MIALTELVEYCNSELRIAEIADWPNAFNGLQIANGGRVTKLGAAVDACSFTIAAAATLGVDFLLVHHGLFWPGLQPLTGAHHRQVKLALDANLALYSAHLPLDVHPQFGNNAQLAQALGFAATEPFCEAKGRLIGLRAEESSLGRVELVRRLEAALGGSVKVIAAGPEQTRNIGVITGGAGSEIYPVARAGIDTFITGEAPHWSAIAAEELGVNLLLGGHYATETVGVKAFAAQLAHEFNLPWEFIDHPTGL